MSEINRAIVGGSGSREHVLAEAAARHVQTLVAPGNGGTQMEANVDNIAAKSVDDIFGVVRDGEYMGQRDLVLIGPEALAVEGLATKLRLETGALVLGAGIEAAQAEADKEWSYNFNAKYNIAQPSARFFDDPDEASEYVTSRFQHANQFVIKDTGLRGGKGVIVPEDWRTAYSSIDNMFLGTMFGSVTERLAIQERYHGQEFSAMVALDNDPNTEPLILNVTGDFKRLNDGDEGPNTGGQGAYGPLSNELLNDSTPKIQEIANKFKAGMMAEGIDTTGMILYIGGMIADEADGDPVVIEYNVRFGDPEAQVSIPLLHEAGNDPFELFALTAQNRLREMNFKKLQQNIGGLAVVISSEGYPDDPLKGQVLHGLDRDYEGVKFYHGGTKLNEDGLLVVNGGRIVTAAAIRRGETPFDDAAHDVYRAVDQITADGNNLHTRSDIGYPARKEWAQ